MTYSPEGSWLGSASFMVKSVKNHAATVGLSRFGIVDLSGPSVPQELSATGPHSHIPFVTVIEAGRKAHSMFRDLLKYPWVFPPVPFTDKEQLMELLPSRMIEPAEKKCQERQT